MKNNLYISVKSGFITNKVVLEVFSPVKEVAVNHLMKIGGLWWLLALVPLIIIYLIRPRPKKKSIPALMFLIKENAKSDKRSFFRRFVRDPLFLLQIIILIAFAIAIAQPFITVKEDVFVETTALVVDASASSQVEIDGKTRFERTIEIAKENVGSENVTSSVTVRAVRPYSRLLAGEMSAPRILQPICMP